MFIEEELIVRHLGYMTLWSSGGDKNEKQIGPTVFGGAGEEWRRYGGSAAGDELILLRESSVRIDFREFHVEGE